MSMLAALLLHWDRARDLDFGPSRTPPWHRAARTRARAITDTGGRKNVLEAAFTVGATTAAWGARQLFQPSEKAYLSYW